VAAGALVLGLATDVRQIGELLIMVYADVVTADLAEWNQNPELLSWLASL